MDNLGTPWSSWCRLCANEDTENHVSIHLRGSNQQLAECEDVKLSLKEAYEKYFLVQSSCEDLLPKHLCQNCYSLISFIMLFNEHVERVQEMYNFLVETPIEDSSDLRSVRLKFEVCDENRFLHFQNNNGDAVFENVLNTDENGGVENTADDSCDSVRLKFDIGDDNSEKWFNFQNNSVTENDQNTKENCGAEMFTTHSIKQENWSIESDVSECEKNNDVDNESLYQDEELYDEKYIANNIQEECEDPFDAMSEDSFWGEDEGPTKRRRSTRNKKVSNTVRTNKLKRNQKKLKDSYCEKKPRITEDFVLDVTCSPCEQKFDLYSKYCEHMETSHGKLAGVDKSCPLCERKLQTWYHLGRHMRYHMPLESRYPIKCPECDNRYTSSAQLEAHVKHKHRNEKPFVCEVCGFCGGTKHSLTQHMFVHTDVAPFECEVCKRRFKKKSRLNFHMDIHGPNKFVCSICGLQLNSRATLKNHAYTHSDKQKHKCDYCGKTFNRSKYLKGHLLLHSGLKPYSCNFCDLAFSIRSLCRGHMKRKHPDELALLDASGDKAYTQNVPKLETLKAVTKAGDNLQPISKIRFGKNCFPCNFCESKFSYRSTLKHHIKIKHPEEFATLEDSSKKRPTKNVRKLNTQKGVTNAAVPKAPTEPVTCEFCGRVFDNRKYCRNHMRRLHPDELDLLDATNNKKNIYTTGETKDANKLQHAATKYSDSSTNAFQSMEESTSDLELQNEEVENVIISSRVSTTTVTNVQKAKSSAVFLITVPGYPSVKVSK